MGEDADRPTCVKVAVRCRPPSTKEINNGERSIAEMREAFGDGDPGCVILEDPAGSEKPAEFAFDIVFGLAVQQSQIYMSVGKPALQKTFEGYNGTIFAYGQTGSGKSFTMAGASGDLRGITPRVNEELFEKIRGLQEGTTRKFLVMCSFFEIYNEIIFDLLNPVADRSKVGGGLQVKEHPVLGIYVKDLTEIVTEESSKLDEMIETGNKNRAVSSTMMNASSSRSHSIFTIKLHQKDDEDPSRNIFAKLNLVDLAGSERQKGTGAQGQTLKEGANINKSLSALGNVINALVETANGKKVFIPYRNSKLTRVLQESLGGNSLCTMLATLSPAACNYDETLGTLRYANRAKAIKVSATKNEEASQISRLKAEVEELKKKLLEGGGGAGGGSGLSEAERKTEQEKHEKQLKEMEAMMNNNWGEKAKMSEEHERKLQKMADERRKAAQALEEERTKRLRLLQEQNDPELTVRGIMDLVSNLPKDKEKANIPSLASGEQPRQWQKCLRAMKTSMDQLREQNRMMLIFQHAFKEDVRLWGEGAEAADMALILGGFNRCTPKLYKIQKGGEKLQQLEGQGLAEASEMADAVRTAIAEVERCQEQLAEEASHTSGEGEKPSASSNKASQLLAAVEQVGRMLHMVQSQLSERTEELDKLASLDMEDVCGQVLHSSRCCLRLNDGQGEATEEGQEETKHCAALQSLMADPRLGALPSFMPQKPLRDYSIEDVMDSPETTEAVIGQLIRWENLYGGKSRKPALELLTRPPPKFLLDVTLAIKAVTGFPANIEGDWPEAREERLKRFQTIADAACMALNVTIDFDPTDVLKGKEVAKTLRLLQLVAVAAAKQQPAEAQGDGTSAGRKQGMARPRELPAFLEAIDRCIQGAKAVVMTQKAAFAAQTAEAAAAAGGEANEAEVAAQKAMVEQQLQEESQAKARQEEILADTERQLEEAKAELKKAATELQLMGSADATGGGGAVEHDPELAELDRQVQELAKTVDAGDGDGEISDVAIGEVESAMLQALASQLEGVKGELAKDETTVPELETQHKELEKDLQEASRVKAQLENEVLRERQREETEQQLAGQDPEEQKMILKAHEEKLNSRVGDLEQQIGQAQAEAEERQAQILELTKEKSQLIEKSEDANVQMQIVQEERDAMREAMEQLWNEWAKVDNELEHYQQSYIDLSERINSQQDESEDLMMVLERVRDEVAGLQKNGFNYVSVAA
eukprot:TRINITY_DN4918_c0_g1_i1.p1 TRINITY_DN4918_c0_g1~~TRINITY_DN4918_c0_g1_i1.p1  ORF type:complete len:1218 (-),score=502.29 TRINITY_DN4918_c0_g1_i1:137-3790(-)